jgi:hypothetical protein
LQIAGLTVVRTVYDSEITGQLAGTQHASYERMVAKLRLIPPKPDSDPPEPLPQGWTLPGWAKAVAVTIAIVAAFALYLYFTGSERRAIHNLPVGARRALFERTLKNLQSLCSPAEESMRSFCLDQARLAQEFPECDRACRDLADRQLARLQLPR